MTQKNSQILMTSRPVGEVGEDNFNLVETDMPAISEGQILCKTLYLSLDPYMRGRMSDAKSYADPVEVGDVMCGETVSEVIESRHPNISVGDIVTSFNGWQNYAAIDGDAVRKINPSHGPISTGVGVLGMPGMTAYMGLLKIGQPKAGETVVVAAASGAVGAQVGQIAKLKGARAVGVAGSPDKCRYVTEELGFDACLNYKNDDFAEQMAAACPDGVDVYFESVGGKTFNTVLPLMNNFARIPVCGLISAFSTPQNPEDGIIPPTLMRSILVKRLMLRGFIVWDFKDQEHEFLSDMPAWIKSGKIKYKEDIVEGLENAPNAFVGLLKGQNFGKLLIKVN